ncbi:MAG TPA: gamma-glutamylcyclotransferase [Stackebrandtia sp.]|uniref:allophanate hydrolase-related protein n=1 Tax=Stackebrandtia sp. TaxID=2023065 RepID=UPI002D486BAB|nr:gamma-glutamylcyclotransferase [Stackebrandtia sp.]HZE39760.1 gamma-glutamylcyclotransferase [Stackebrandtia sp.]
MVHMFLNGGAMRGGPLHDMLRGAPLVAEINTAPMYRFYSVGDRYPALDPVSAGGRAVAGELYDMPLDVLHASLLPNEPPELELSVIRLADGTASLSMVLRPNLRGSSELVDISEVGSWNAYQEARA